MDKCWFVLKQAYEPPPDDSLRRGSPDGPLCLGHIIPSLSQLDHVVNREEFVPFERKMMPGKPHTRINFSWDDEKCRELGLMGTAKVPIAAVAGVDVSASIGGLFSKRVTNRHEFSRLDQWTMTPSRPYVNQCLNAKEVEEHIKRTRAIYGRWKIYMVTGLMIARGRAFSSTSESKGVVALNGVSAELPLLAETGPEVHVGTHNRSTITTVYASDFIWAIRLAKITKNGLQKNWSIETVIGKESMFGRKATFSADPTKSELDARALLAEEGLDDSQFEVTTVDSEDEIVFVTPGEGEEECTRT